MAKFYAFFGPNFKGMAPTGGEGGQGQGSRPTVGSRLPDIHAPEHEKQLGEWLGSRSETSHEAVGFEPGQDVMFRDATGAERPAKILHEERDQHTGNVDVTFAADSSTDSGTYVTRFKPNEARSMVQTETKRTRD